MTDFISDQFSFTSNFWNLWIIVLTLANVFGCWWLIAWSSKKRPGEAEAGEVTGHTWDENLSEYNNPLPRWWLWLFHITLVFGLVYFALYPALGTWRGYLNWTQQEQYDKEMETAEQQYGPLFARFAAIPIPQLASDPEALKIGQRLFINYCASCHGSDAGGSPGFPNLADGNWLYGGEPEAILSSILDGRPQAQKGQTGMPPMGAAVGGEQGAAEVANYVLSLSGAPHDKAKAAAGKSRFAVCAGCHGLDGKGNQALGAPNLTDNIWLYGRSVSVISQTIMEGRKGLMPANRDFLGEDKAHLLATYIYSLSNQ
jgi:cytochrome c oxidase cbb3-type subunit 3